MLFDFLVDPAAAIFGEVFFHGGEIAFNLAPCDALLVL